MSEAASPPLESRHVHRTVCPSRGSAIPRTSLLSRSRSAARASSARVSSSRSSIPHLARRLGIVAAYLVDDRSASSRCGVCTPRPGVTVTSLERERSRGRGARDVQFARRGSELVVPPDGGARHRRMPPTVAVATEFLALAQRCERVGLAGWISRSCWPVCCPGPRSRLDLRWNRARFRGFPRWAGQGSNLRPWD